MEVISYLKVLLSYHIHKTSLRRGRSYIKSPEWVINKRATINLKKKDDKCFHYSITLALNHQKIKNHPEYQILNLLLIIIIGKV